MFGQTVEAPGLLLESTKHGLRFGTVSAGGGNDLRLDRFRPIWDSGNRPLSGNRITVCVLVEFSCDSVHEVRRVARRVPAFGAPFAQVRLLRLTHSRRSRSHHGQGQAPRLRRRLQPLAGPSDIGTLENVGDGGVSVCKVETQPCRANARLKPRRAICAVGARNHSRYSPAPARRTTFGKTTRGL
jgi:hypothetical protein